MPLNKTQNCIVFDENKNYNSLQSFQTLDLS